MFLLQYMALSLVILAGQDAGLSGTWEGDTRMTGTTEIDHIVLVLEKNADSYTGKISDRLSLFKNEPITNVSFKEGNLRFKAIALSGTREVTLNVGLNYFYGRLLGGWGAGPGDFGPLDLSRQKAGIFPAP